MPRVRMLRVGGKEEGRKDEQPLTHANEAIQVPMAPWATDCSR